jgi:hypothetical protein
MAKDRVEQLAHTYQHALDETLKTLDKVPADKRFKQIKPGKAHPLWLLGHLAFSNDLIVNMLCLNSPSQLSPVYMQKFAPSILGGAAITPNAADYPAWDEILANYKKTASKSVELIRGLTDSDLTGGPKGKVPPEHADFFKVLGNTLGHMADHDAYHRGQIGLIAALD